MHNIQNPIESLQISEILKDFGQRSRRPSNGFDTWHGNLRSHILTHWDRDKMAAIFQTTFWYIFSSMKMHTFRLRFQWILLFLRVQLITFLHWHQPGDELLSEPMMVSVQTHICIPRLQWVNCWSASHDKHVNATSPKCYEMFGKWYSPPPRSAKTRT